jgi:hypothetical protein
MSEQSSNSKYFKIGLISLLLIGGCVGAYAIYDVIVNTIVIPITNVKVNTATLQSTVDMYSTSSITSISTHTYSITCTTTSLTQCTTTNTSITTCSTTLYSTTITPVITTTSITLGG